MGLKSRSGAKTRQPIADGRQEGIQCRRFGGGKYLVTYAFEQLPKTERGKITHHMFGRLRVSVIEK